MHPPNEEIEETAAALWERTKACLNPAEAERTTADKRYENAARQYVSANEHSDSTD
jgi:hypothetical protein